LFQAISFEGDDGTLHLKEIHTGADVLHAVQCFMGLAVSDQVLALELRELSKTSKVPRYESPLESHQTYMSVHLHDPELQMRLIELLPGEDDDPIRINLFAIDSVTSQPYEALSYVWGSRDVDVTVSVNDRPFKVSANLAQAFSCLRLLEGTKCCG
jgi:hypothetical protein